jgi:myo-inositol-1(or 4)-monophosphatase
MDYSHWLNSGISVAHRAAATIMPYYGGEFTVDIKENDPRNLVTEADRATESAMVSLLRDLHPDHTILGEEGTGTGIHPTLPTWVIDPIDGTNNFSHHLPLFAVSIGVYYQGKVRVAVIYAPVVGWLFTAVEGGGATLNGQPLHVSQRGDLVTALASCEWSRRPSHRKAALATAANLLDHILAFRSMGSAAISLAAVAAGWLDVYYNYRLDVWDIMAGALIIEEAGGTVTHLDGSPLDFTQKNILATNGLLHSTVLPMIEAEAV